MHMTCLLEVLSAKSETLQARELETCKTLVVDTSEFDISYPDEQGNWPPPEATCSPPIHKTCDVNFLTAQYSSMDWSANAPTKPCMPCPTPAPQPTSPEAPTTDFGATACIGSGCTVVVDQSGCP